MYCVKRTYGANEDWLHAWSDKWGTSCMGVQEHAMKFETIEEVNSACDRANTSCKNMPEGMAFSVDKIK